MIGHHQFLMDFKAEELSFDMSSSSGARNTYEALDLSRRRDSVETRKTPSPHTSCFEENSPSMYDSPSTTPSIPQSTPMYHDSSQFRQSPSDYAISHSYGSKRETPSPNEAIYKHLQRSCAISEAMTPYLLQAASLHQSIAQRHTPTRESDDSSDTSSFNTNMNLHPMVVGRNGKLSRPFKAYPTDPLSMTASFSATESMDSKSSEKSSFDTNMNLYPMVVGRNGKLSRPFQAYSKDPLSITTSFSSAESIDSQSADNYSIFRKHMLEQIHAANGEHPTVSNPKMRRTSSITVDCENKSSIKDFLNDSVSNNTKLDSSNGFAKDNAYYEQRQRNNAAAKKFRDRRRMKEDELAMRAVFLERENMELKIQLAVAQKQLTMLSVSSNS